ncbi:DNA alkylation repair protein, partial [Anaerosporobacter sp.]
MKSINEIEQNKDIRAKIEELSEPEYQVFTSKLLPGVSNIIGVRLPKLRKIAKEIAKGDWRTYLEYASDESYEEIMLQGMVIGYVKGSLQERIPFIEKFVEKIDNWSVCDSFCSGLKVTKIYSEEMWLFLQSFFQMQGEFEVRFGVVMLLNYYLDEAYIEPVCKIFDTIRHDGYYVKMAVAWAISINYVKFPEAMETYLKRNKLDDFT